MWRAMAGSQRLWVGIRGIFILDFVLNVFTEMSLAMLLVEVYILEECLSGGLYKRKPVPPGCKTYSYRRAWLNSSCSIGELILLTNLKHNGAVPLLYTLKTHRNVLDMRLSMRAYPLSKNTHFRQTLQSCGRTQSQ